MAIELKMQAFPDDGEGTLAKWLVKEDDQVRPCDLLAEIEIEIEIENDKAIMEYEALDGGRIARLRIAEGTEEVAVLNVVIVAPRKALAAQRLNAESGTYGSPRVRICNCEARRC